MKYYAKDEIVILTRGLITLKVNKSLVSRIEQAKNDKIRFIST